MLVVVVVQLAELDKVANLEARERYQIGDSDE